MFQSMLAAPLSISTPTMMRAGAVAAEGTIPVTGARRQDTRNSTPTTIELSPVRAPSAMPVEDSTKVVTVEVPRHAPQQVATASAMPGSSASSAFSSPPSSCATR